MKRKYRILLITLACVTSFFTYARWSCQDQLVSQLAVAVSFYENNQITELGYLTLLESASGDYLNCVGGN